jgi:hypothetical protein
MKLKEISPSIYHSLILLSTPVQRLKKRKTVTLPVIVSLTSIPSRLRTLEIVIRSVLNQDVSPKKIVLWLNNDLKPQIPKRLERLTGDIFEIKYSGLNCSHRKLIHSLELFKDDIIITCDDDLIYNRHWLSLIYTEHQKQPEKIIALRTRYISYEHGVLLPYKQWVSTSEVVSDPKFIIPVGSSGVLYPPNCLDNKVTEVDLFLKLAPKADDLWFKAMSLLKGTVSFQPEKTGKEPIPIVGTQFISLKKENVKGDKNRSQWLALTAFFKLPMP